MTRLVRLQQLAARIASAQKAVSDFLEESGWRYTYKSSDKPYGWVKRSITGHLHICTTLEQALAVERELLLAIEQPHDTNRSEGLPP